MENHVHFSLPLSHSHRISARSLSPAINFYQGRVFRTAGKIFAQGNRTAVVVGKLSASYSRPSDPDRINLVEQYVFYIRFGTSLTSSTVADMQQFKLVEKIFNRFFGIKL